MQNSIKDLIERCIAKDKQAWKEFVVRFQGIATRAIKTRLGRRGYSFQYEDVKDIVQNVFLDMWEKSKLEQVKDRDNIEGWVAIVSQNAAIDYLRRSSSFSNRLQSTIACPQIETETDLLDLIPSDIANPFKEASTAELNLVLDELISALPARERLVITLNLLHEKTHRQIAEFLMIPINTVSTLIRRTKANLKKELEKRGYRDF